MNETSDTETTAPNGPITAKDVRQLFDLAGKHVREQLAADRELAASALTFSTWIAGLMSAGFGALLFNLQKVRSDSLLASHQPLFLRLIIAASIIFVASLFVTASIHLLTHRYRYIQRKLLTHVTDNELLLMSSPQVFQQIASGTNTLDDLRGKFGIAEPRDKTGVLKFVQRGLWPEGRNEHELLDRASARYHRFSGVLLALNQVLLFFGYVIIALLAWPR